MSGLHFANLLFRMLHLHFVNLVRISCYFGKENTVHNKYVNMSLLVKITMLLQSSLPETPTVLHDLIMQYFGTFYEITLDVPILSDLPSDVCRSMNDCTDVLRKCYDTRLLLEKIPARTQLNNRTSLDAFWDIRWTGMTRENVNLLFAYHPNVRFAVAYNSASDQYLLPFTLEFFASHNMFVILPPDCYGFLKSTHPNGKAISSFKVAIALV